MDWFVIVIVVVIIVGVLLLTMHKSEGYGNALPSNVAGGRYRGTLVNGRYTLALEENRLILYGPSDPANKRSGSKDLWYIPSSPGNYLVMQSDGNLVLYDSNDNWVWDTETSGKGLGPFELTLAADGTLSILDNGTNEVIHTVFKR
jgi:hypothetical protein